MHLPLRLHLCTQYMIEYIPSCKSKTYSHFRYMVRHLSVCMCVHVHACSHVSHRRKDKKGIILIM